MRNRETWLILAVLAGLYLYSKPECERGCKTVAEHLLTHGIRGLLG